MVGCNSQTEVAIGIIRNPDGEILLSQRLSGTHLAGCWEFPGGKLQPGECPETALQRELREEIGIEVNQFQLLQTLEHHYPDRHLTLHFFLVEAWHGKPIAKEGQPLRWVAQSELKMEEFPEANKGVVEKLRVGK